MNKAYYKKILEANILRSEQVLRGSTPVKFYNFPEYLSYWQRRLGVSIGEGRYLVAGAIAHELIGVYVYV